MPTTSQARVAYVIKGGERRTMNVEYEGTGGVEKNAEAVREIIAAEHKVDVGHVELLTGKPAAKAAEAAKADAQEASPAKPAATGKPAAKAKAPAAKQPAAAEPAPIGDAQIVSDPAAP